MKRGKDMKLTIIHGQMHKGSTYHITEQLKNKIGIENQFIHEFYLPKDMPNFCVGCFRCFKEGEQYCPHQAYVSKIVTAMESSDVIIVDSPNYCMAMSGQLKALFDHLAFMWMSHRPNRTMFGKIGIAISTTAGTGAKKTTKAIAEQLFWLGIPYCFQIPVRVSASSWEEVSQKTKEKIEKMTNKIARKVKKKKHTPFKMKFIFYMMKLSQKGNTWNEVDKNHWIKNGWLLKEYPWNQ